MEEGSTYVFFYLSQIYSSREGCEREVEGLEENMRDCEGSDSLMCTEEKSHYLMFFMEYLIRYSPALNLLCFLENHRALKLTP